MKTSKVKVTRSVGKVDLVLEKEQAEKWPNLGDPLDGGETFLKASQLSPEFRDWEVSGKVHVTHDVVHLTLMPPVDNKVRVFYVRSTDLFYVRVFAFRAFTTSCQPATT